MRPRAVLRTGIAIVFAACAQPACDSGVNPSPLGYAGEWTGTTSNGTPIRFSVSATDVVTSITLVYNFSAVCAGTLAYTDLALPIRTLEPPGPPPYDQPGFGYAVNGGAEAGATAIVGHFSPDRESASGKFVLVNFGACGTAGGTWTATRR